MFFKLLFFKKSYRGAKRNGERKGHQTLLSSFLLVKLNKTRIIPEWQLREESRTKCFSITVNNLENPSRRRRSKRRLICLPTKPKVKNSHHGPVTRTCDRWRATYEQCRCTTYVLEAQIKHIYIMFMLDQQCNHQSQLKMLAGYGKK